MRLLWKVSQTGDLKRHINTVHNGQKDHKCDSCGKLFSKPCNLKIHISTVHNCQKDHKCDSCGKLFSPSMNLKIHISTVHNGQKDHKCDSCEKIFSTGGNLKIHVNAVHNGQKDHKCDSCGKAFSTAGSMRKHIISDFSSYLMVITKSLSMISSILKTYFFSCFFFNLRLNIKTTHSVHKFKFFTIRITILSWATTAEWHTTTFY